MGETRQAPGKALARAQGPGLSASRTGSCWHPGWGQGRSPAYTHSCLTPAGAVLLGGGGGIWGTSGRKVESPGPTQARGHTGPAAWMAHKPRTELLLAETWL